VNSEVPLLRLHKRGLQAPHPPPPTSKRPSPSAFELANATSLLLHDPTFAAESPDTGAVERTQVAFADTEASIRRVVSLVSKGTLHEEDAEAELSGLYAERDRLASPSRPSETASRSESRSRRIAETPRSSAS
jgi:hypothetical protein